MKIQGFNDAIFYYLFIHDDEFGFLVIKSRRIIFDYSAFLSYF